MSVENKSSMTKDGYIAYCQAASVKSKRIRPVAIAVVVVSIALFIVCCYMIFYKELASVWVVLPVVAIFGSASWLINVCVSCNVDIKEKSMQFDFFQKRKAIYNMQKQTKF